MQILLNYRKNRVFREVGLPYFIVAKKVGILKCVFFWKIYLFLYLREQKILKTIKNNKYFKRYKSQNPSKYGKKRIYKNNKEENVKWKSGQDLNGSYLIAIKRREESEDMKNMNYADAIIDGYNAAVGAVIAVLSYILGEHWVLFVAFLLLNVTDWLTGWMKSRMAGKENSMKGWKGVLKKLGYWLMIMVAFGAGAVFIEIGKTIGIDLGITTLLGWFVLASLLINEIRSILENFVEAGFNVPRILIKGLEVADKVVNKDNQEGE